MKEKSLLILILLTGLLVVVEVFDINISVGSRDLVAGPPQFNYIWADSFLVTTSGVDCVFTEPYEHFTFWADSGDAFYKIGDKDTSDWGSRDWIKLKAGMSLSFGPATPIKRLEIKMSAASSPVYNTGIKKVQQW